MMVFQLGDFYLELLNQFNNLVTLCNNCHMQIEWNSELNFELAKDVCFVYDYNLESPND